MRSIALRNVFDQYRHPENRLTHALLASLAEDKGLLRRFVKKVANRTAASRLQIYEQALPGDPANLPEDEAGRRGLPDGCVTDNDGWALLIESKVASHPTADQLHRHLRTAKRRGIRRCSLLVLTTGRHASEAVHQATYMTWSQLYIWLRQQSKRSHWAELCARYFEDAEIRLPQDGYLIDGTLTVFTGIPFSYETPYTYAEAKRQLDLLRSELLKRKPLVQQLGADPDSAGRSAVTGSKSLAVWDFISLKSAKGSNRHTQNPHLTLGIHIGHVEASVTIPNGVAPAIRSRLLGLDRDEFADRVHIVTRAIASAVRGTGASPMIVVVQRRYRTQRSAPIVDAELRFDPRTAFDEVRSVEPGIKHQPEWLRTVYDVLTKRRSNLQFQIGAKFPYNTCRIVDSPKLVAVIERVWLACAPILEHGP